MAEVIKPWFNNSSNDGSSCVDVQFVSDDKIQMRNSNFPDGPVLDFTAEEYDVFIAGAKESKFDRPGV